MEVKDLKEISKNIRVDVIDSIHSAGSGHPGSSLSCIECIVSLYHEIMDLSKDKFILSKGHAAPTWYAVLASVGKIQKEELYTLRKIDSNLQGHPTNKIDGIDVCSGSLGQGLSVANGIAIARKIDEKDGYVYCLLGDGELQEGQVWEAVMTANKYNLDNLIVFVDNNGLQIDGKIEDVKGITNIQSKFDAFGFNTFVIDGHNEEEIVNTVNKAKEVKGKPTAIILKTVKGKGISYMEDVAEWHGKSINDEDYEKAKMELGGNV